LVQLDPQIDGGQVLSVRTTLGYFAKPKQKFIFLFFIEK